MRLECTFQATKQDSKSLKDRNYEAFFSNQVVRDQKQATRKKMLKTQAHGG